MRVLCRQIFDDEPDDDGTETTGGPAEVTGVCIV